MYNHFIGLFPRLAACRQRPKPRKSTFWKLRN